MHLETVVNAKTFILKWDYDELTLETLNMIRDKIAREKHNMLGLRYSRKHTSSLHSCHGLVRDYHLSNSLLSPAFIDPGTVTSMTVLSVDHQLLKDQLLVFTGMTKVFCYFATLVKLLPFPFIPG